MDPKNTSETPLGKQVSYNLSYDPTLLCPILRETGRIAAGISDSACHQYGEDIWNIYELSWLSPSGKPEVAIAELRVPADSPCLIESKSLKLYCNSLNMTRLIHAEQVQEILMGDLSKAAGAKVSVSLLLPHHFDSATLAGPEGICIDGLESGDFAYTIDPTLLTIGHQRVQQTLFSRLFRSCCPVTGQPDWATVTVNYEGARIIPENLLRYLVSYREHSGFHEACVERIFADIMERCQPSALFVSARFTRRGGIDINPVRSTTMKKWPNIRDPRQ